MEVWSRRARNLVWLTQLGVSLAAPPLLCLGGAWWLRQRFSLGLWVLVLGLILGIGGMASAAAAFFRRARRQAEREDSRPPDTFNTHR